MAKKTDKAVEDLAEEVKKLRKENEKLVKTLEKTRDEQETANREVLDAIQNLSTTGEITESDEAETSEPAPESVEEPSESPADGRNPREELEITNTAKRRAQELNVDLSSVKGTGSGGRVLVKDVEAAAEG